jgi:DeoR family glycerol-3-phosphate regulon repressor
VIEHDRVRDFSSIFGIGYMDLSDRQARIAEIVRAEQFVTVDKLAETFHVATQTIRRDINLLCDMGLARRKHGGVECLPDKSNLSFSTRRILNLAAKRAIAKSIAPYIKDGASLAFSIGTTPVIVMEALLNHHNLTVLTNNLNVAIVASRNPTFKVHIAGGALRNHDLDILGNGMTSFFAAYKADIGIYGVGGVDEDGTLLDFTEDEVLARQLIQKNSNQTFLVLDHSKFGRNAHVRGGTIDQPSKIFCDQPPEERYLAAIGETEINYAKNCVGVSA